MTTSPPSSPGRVFSAVKDAALAAFVALALAAPVMGFQTFVAGTEIQLEPRWWLVGYAVAAVFAGRLIFRLVIGGDGHQPVGQKWFRRKGGRPIGTPDAGGLKFIA
ncbi:MAG: DUF3382 domain-containing protein, partial [Tepidamorphaceae bacterium]